MEYDYFIETVKNAQTSHVKAIYFPDSCAPHSVPEAFAFLIPDVIKLLELQYEKLCGSSRKLIALFGLQPSSLAITSQFPLQTNRIINQEAPWQHFCCSLSYLALCQDELSTICDWQNIQTIIVDFTTGLVVDGEYYAACVFGSAPLGTVYGALTPARLTTTWANISKKVKTLC